MTYKAILCSGIIVKSGDGYTNKTYSSENAFHRPYIPSGQEFVITSAVMKNLGEVHPKRGEEFTVLEVNVDHSAFTGITRSPYNAVMLRISHDEEQTQTDGTKKTVTVIDGTVYGWIDKTEPVSLGSKVNTRIYWHVDWWLTGQTNIRPSLLEGRIKRGPSSLARPTPSQPRYWRQNLSFDIKADFDTITDKDGNSVKPKGPWVIALLTNSNSVTSRTSFKTLFWPSDVSGMKFTDASGNDHVVYFESLTDLYSGGLEEYLGVDPGCILGVWISPVPPANDCSSSNKNCSMIIDTNKKSSKYIAYFTVDSTPLLSLDLSESNVARIYTDDLHKTVVIDPYNAIYATLPWKITSTSVKYALDIASNGAYLYLDMQNGAHEDAVGRQIQIPLLSVSVTSNATSSYVYSGQRDYDIYTAKLQAEQSRASGIANSGTSALSGAVGGAVAGGGIGAGIGAVAGLVTSLIGTQVNYQLTKEYDAKSQAALDKLTANQTSSALISGNGNAWQKLGSWKFVVLKWDTVSYDELENEQSSFGYLTDSFRSGCESLIKLGGPFRIESLHVEGLCPEGNKYIQNLFQQGCYIDVIKNNPDSTITGS